MNTIKALVPVEDYDVICAKQLQKCQFVVGSFDKRFAQTMALFTGTHSGDIQITMTDKQQRLLRYMVHRYRRQIPEHVCNEWCVNPYGKH